MPRVTTGYFTDHVIPAVWVVHPNTTGNLDTGNGQAAFRCPGACTLLSYDKSTGTALAWAYSDTSANSTGISVALRNTTDAADLLGTNITLTSAKYVMDGILVSTQTTLNLDKGDWVMCDVDTANSHKGGLTVQAFLYGR